MKTAAFLVIGDEILSGKVKDENSFVFTNVMFERGVKVERIVVIPDDVNNIAQSVFELSSKFDYVCTSGGVGPTHDDKTFAGVALGFSLPIKEHREAVIHFQNAQIGAGRGHVVSDVQKKMLKFPCPCTVYFVEPLWLPLVVVRNVYLFPGVPSLFREMMTKLSHLFLGGKFYREILFTDLLETAIADDLEKVQNAYPDVSIGSYPQASDKPYRVMITVEGTEQAKVVEVLKTLLSAVSGRQTN